MKPRPVILAVSAILFFSLTSSIAAQADGHSDADRSATSDWLGRGVWHQTETEHFTVIYQPADESVAAELVGFADSVLEELAGYLGMKARRRIPVVIRGTTGDANGYFTLLPTRIVLFAATPSTPIIGPALDQWLRIVFAHEVTHYLQVTDPVGWGRLSRILGPSASLVNLVAMPHWMAEGVAVYTESAVTGAGRGASPVFEMQYVAALLADEFWSFNQTLYSSDFAPRSRVYVGGYVMVDYIVQTWGMDRFVALSRDYLQHPLLGIRRAISRTLGMDVDEFYAAMLADLESRYAERDQAIGGDLVSPEDYGYWFLVRGGTELYGAPPTGYTRLVPEEDWQDGIQQAELQGALHLDVEPFSLSTTDDLVIGIKPFVDELRPDRWVGFTDLVAIDRHSGEARRVTRGRRLYHSSLAPDARSAVAVERIGAYSRLVLINLGPAAASVPGATASDGARPDATGLDAPEVRIVWEPEHTYMSAPSVSPDGRAAVVSASYDGEQDLYLVELATGSVQRLTHSAGVAEYFPVYVSQTTVWFTADPTGPLALYELDLGSGEVEHLLTDPDGIFYGTPAGSGAVYASYSYTGPSVKQIGLLTRTAVEWPSGVDLPDAIGEPPVSSGAVATSGRGETSGVAERAFAAGDLESTRYLDWPRTEFWLPLILPGRSEAGVGVQAGGLVAAASVLEKTTILGYGWMNLSNRAPTLALQLIHTSGPWMSTTQIDSAPDYLDESGLRARLRSSLSTTLGREIARWGIGHTQNSLAAAIGVLVASESADGATFGEFFAGPPQNQAGASANIAYMTHRETRRADLFGPAGLSAAVSGTFRAPLDASGVAWAQGVFGAQAAIDGRLPLGSAMVDVTALAATSGTTGIDGLRGSAIPLLGVVPPSADPALLLRLGVDSPARLLDIGFRGFSITRFGVSGYIQQAIDYETGGLAMRTESSVAVEVAARVGYLSASFLPAIGLAATIPHNDPGATRLSLTFRCASTGLGIVIGGTE